MSSAPASQGYVVTGEPEGKMVDGNYFHEGSDKSRAVLVLTDVFGLAMVNCKIIADQLSKTLDCDVWVPDLFAGKPPSRAEDVERYLPQKASDPPVGFFTRLSLIPMLLFRLHLWWRSRPSVADKRLDTFIAKLRAEKEYEKLGAVGYSFGGGAAIRVGGRGLIDSIVVAHPSGRASRATYAAIKVPASFVCAEVDPPFPKKARDGAEAIFAARKDKPDFVEYEFKDYPGTAYGFATRPNFELPEIRKAFNEAFEQTVAWFKKTLQ